MVVEQKQNFDSERGYKNRNVDHLTDMFSYNHKGDKMEKLVEIVAVSPFPRSAETVLQPASSAEYISTDDLIEAKVS